MKGILGRGDHRFVAVDSVAEAWNFIRRNVKVDLVILELKLKGEGGLQLIQRLKADCFLSSIPMVVYTAHADRESVKTVLQIKVQNFLLKPYREEAVYAEISRSKENPWRLKLFESAKSFCARTNLPEEKFRRMLVGMCATLEASKEVLVGLTKKQEIEPIEKELDRLSKLARMVGAHGIVACVQELKAKVKTVDWPGFEANLEALDFAAGLLFNHLKPSHCPEDFLSEAEINSEKEARERALWENAASEERCPVIGWEQLQREIDKLSDCPIVDSIAAGFQMSATGHPTSLSPLLDLVRKDPGLTAQILMSANKLKKKDKEEGDSAIEESRMAVGLLGENRLASLAAGFVTVEERMFDAPPHASWANFRMFQLGTARLAQFVCKYLEMPNLEAAAYTGGLLHDLGKILLIHLHPFAFQAILQYALQTGVKLETAERFFIGASTQEMAIYFAEKHGLPRRFTNVLRWMHDPEDATEDAELVALVSLARDLCRHNHVGFAGDTPQDNAISLADTPEWRVLRSRVYLNFDLKKFELQAHRECLELKRELLGLVSKNDQ